MPLIFFALSMALLSYADKEPHCYAGAVIFFILAVLFLDTALPNRKESLFRKKK